MKSIKQIALASILGLALSPVALAGDISGGFATPAPGDISGGRTVAVAGDISGGKASAGDISGGKASLGDISGVLVDLLLIFFSAAA